MTSEEIIQELERYRSELTRIMERFVESRDSLAIRSEDDPRYRTIILEIIDLVNDAIGKNQYSLQIAKIFNEGVCNFYESPSYKSIEDIVSVINSIITRLKRNPDFYVKNESEKPNETEKTELKPPDKVTLKWLWEYVPHSFWALLGTLLIGAFGFGVKFADTNLYKSLTSLENAQVKSPIQPTSSSLVGSKIQSQSNRSNIQDSKTTNVSGDIKVLTNADRVLEESICKDIDDFNKYYSHIDLNLECQNKPEYMGKYRQAQALLNTIEAKAKKTGNKEILETFVWPKHQGIHRASNSCP